MNTPGKLSTTTFLVIAAIGIFVIFFTLRLPSSTFLWREIHNTGHTPLFGLLSLIILGLSFRIFKNLLQKRYKHYLLALAITLAAGLITEFIQIYLPGDADLGDFLRDTGGAVSFLGFMMAFDTKITIFPGISRSRRKFLLMVTAFFILLASLTPLFLWTAAYAHRSNAFPRILGFESTLERKFVRTQNADLISMESPSYWISPGDNTAGKLMLSPGAYPGFSVSEPFPDWRGYESLTFSVYSELDTVFNLNVRIDDKRHDQSYSDRYNGGFAIKKGGNTIIISLEEIANAPASRKLDIGAIKAVYFFVGKVTNGFSFYVSEILLTKKE